MREKRIWPRGRGSDRNPADRFSEIEIELEPGEEPERMPTLFLRDDSRSVLARNDSPDIPYELSLNPYRGCEHGCTYCYARTYHEFLGFSAGLDFETRILVKEEAPELLRKELAKKSYRPSPLNLSGVTDAYQPVERKLQVTRGCLEVLVEFRHPAMIVTKNALVTRDLDLLSELAKIDGAAVAFSLITLDTGLTANLEPRTSTPRNRLKAIRQLTEAGVPCGVLLAPVIPGLTDHEIPAIVEATAHAGATFARCMPLRLPGAVAELFENWLEQHGPLKKEKILNKIREMRGGSLNDPRFGTRMTGEGVLALQIQDLFQTACRRYGMASTAEPLSTRSFQVPGGMQLSLFGEDGP